MASMGLLGAVSGAAGGASKMLMADMEEARATRLENLRTTNTRETNRINNDQRNEQAMAQLDKGQEYSLAELAQRGEQDSAKLDQQAAIKEAERVAGQKTYTDELDDEGNLIGQRESGTNKWGAAGESTRANTAKTPDKLVIAKFLQDAGVAQGDIVDYVSGNKSPETVKRELTLKLAEDPMRDPENLPSEVDAIMQMIYPEGGAGETAKPQAAAGRSYEEMFATLKEKNAGKYSDADIQKYLKEKYGVSP